MGKINNAARCAANQLINIVEAPAVAAGAATVAVQEKPAVLAPLRALATSGWATGYFLASSFEETLKGVATDTCPNRRDLGWSAEHPMKEGFSIGAELGGLSANELDLGTPDWFENK